MSDASDLPATAVKQKKQRRVNRRGRQADGSASPIDVHVGTRVKLRRTLLGLTQQDLSKALGLTFQQIQKYERGANRVSCSRLYDLSRALDVPVGFFFDGMDDETKAASTAVSYTKREEEPARLMQAAETVELVRAYYLIRDGNVRRNVYSLARALAQCDTDKETA